jgi:hypothetical protein
MTLGAMVKRSQVSDLTIRHELEVMSVKAALTTAIRGRENYDLSEFMTWPALCSFTAHDQRDQLVTVKPDGFIRITETSGDDKYEHAFFLEVDRSTETQDVLLSKVYAYLAYYRSGKFAERVGLDREQYKEAPFRVLLVCKSSARRDNTAARLLAGNPPISTFAVLTTFAEAKDDPLGRIWVQPKDCEPQALQGSAKHTLFGIYQELNGPRPQDVGHRLSWIAQRGIPASWPLLVATSVVPEQLSGLSLGGRSVRFLSVSIRLTLLRSTVESLMVHHGTIAHAA